MSPNFAQGCPPAPHALDLSANDAYYSDEIFFRNDSISAGMCSRHSCPQLHGRHAGKGVDIGLLVVDVERQFTPSPFTLTPITADSTPVFPSNRNINYRT